MDVIDQADIQGKSMCERNTDTHPGDLISTTIEDRGIASDAVDNAVLDDLVVANHILFKHRVVDAFGHVSIRHPSNPERFLLSRNKAPAIVTAADIIEFHLDGTPVNARGRAVYLERFIHGEIYAERADVHAVIHSHASEVVPFGVSQQLLKPVWHMSGFLGLDTPVFEIRDVVGDSSDLLIRTRELGKALAGSLGRHCVVLMRGHGATIVGDALKQCVFRAIYTQLNAEIQMNAMRLGDVTYLEPGEVEATTRSVGSQIDRAWNLWKSAT
ncbi:MAG: hypothetical protein DHS20C01_30390 [marine bacterium B5-7]|nr:MAG: hypothetical protein DHS20C01_30390 [marine bacterium B5-7]